MSATAWTRVCDGLPEFGVPVLLTDGKSVLVGQCEADSIKERRGEKPWRWVACGASGYEWEWDFDSFGREDPVTHWMPLPELPRQDDAKETT